jgi:ankyrin repeat protein
MSLATLPEDIFLDNEISCSLSFSDAVNLKKTSKFFNGCFNYNHDPRLDDQCAIKLASERGNLGAVQCLLDVKYVDPATTDNYPIKVASRKGHWEVVQALLASGQVDPSAGDNSPLREACSNGHLEVVRLLIGHPNFDLSNPSVYAAMIDAAKNGHVDIVRFFLTNVYVDANHAFSARLLGEVIYFPMDVVELIFEAGKTKLITSFSTGVV